MNTRLRSTSAAALTAGVLLAGSSGAVSKSVMKLCGDQWKHAKGRRHDERRDLAAIPSAMPRPAEGRWPSRPSFIRFRACAAAAPTPSYGQGAPTAGFKTAGECNAEYAANKAAIGT